MSRSDSNGFASCTMKFDDHMRKSSFATAMQDLRRNDHRQIDIEIKMNGALEGQAR